MRRCGRIVILVASLVAVGLGVGCSSDETYDASEAVPGTDDFAEFDATDADVDGTGEESDAPVDETDDETDDEE